MIQITRDAIRNDPKEIFNWWVLVCTWVWSFSGVAKGFDEGKPHQTDVFFQKANSL